MTKHFMCPGLALAFSLCIAPLAVVGAETSGPTSGLKMDPRNFVTKEQLRHGPFKIDVPGLGMFEIRDLALRTDPRANCAAEIESIKRQLRGRAARGVDLSSGAAVKIQMDKTGCSGPNGEILLCCMYDGTACVATVGVLNRY